jgi:hypothetical protein
VKYKIKFDIRYPSDLSENRNEKISTIFSEIKTEIECDLPIPVPNHNSIIELGGEEYDIISISHKLDENYYTTILKVENRNYRLKKESEKLENEYKRKMEKASLDIESYKKYAVYTSPKGGLFDI